MPQAGTMPPGAQWKHGHCLMLGIFPHMWPALLTDAEVGQQDAHPSAPHFCLSLSHLRKLAVIVELAWLNPCAAGGTGIVILFSSTGECKKRGSLQPLTLPPPVQGWA